MGGLLYNFKKCCRLVKMRLQAGCSWWVWATVYPPQLKVMWAGWKCQAMETVRKFAT